MLLFSRQFSWLSSILKSVARYTKRRRSRRCRNYQKSNWTGGHQWIFSFVEALEDRALLTEVISVSLDVGGNLLVEDSSTSGLTDNVTLLVQASELVISDPDNVLVTSVGTQVSDHEVRVPLTAITSQRVVVNLNQGDDRLDAVGLETTLALEATGGQGNDTISSGSQSDTILGGAGNDILNGGSGDDLIIAGGGRDTVSGGSGDDRIYGRSGNDSLSGDDGDDTIRGGAGRDTIEGGGDADQLGGGGGSDAVSGGDGVDQIRGGGGRNVLGGGDGPDALVGGSGRDTLTGGGGDDTLKGGGGADSLSGDAGADRAVLSADADFTLTDALLTGSGNDTIDGLEVVQVTGGASANTVDATGLTLLSLIFSGEGGDDTVTGGALDDTISGGDGADSINGRNGNDVVSGDGGDDFLQGGTGLDFVDGGDGDDRVLGLGSSGDTLRGGPGNDTLDGGAGTGDIISEIGDVSFTLTTTQLTGLGTDTVLNVEGAILVGGASANAIDVSTSGVPTTLTGGGGDDTITGGTAIDVLVESGDVNFTATSNSLTGLGTDVLLNVEGLQLTGGASANTLDASLFGNFATLNGAGGNDVILSAAGGSFAIGGDGDDTITGSSQFDVLTGNAGNDVIDGREGADNLDGGTGNDIIDGFVGNDTITGDEGDDSIDGGAGADEINSGPGNDTANGGDGDDVVIGGEGDDQVDGGAGTDIVAGRGCGLPDDVADSVADGVLEVNINACREQRDLAFENRVPEFTSTIDAAINPSAGMGADRQNVYLATGEYVTGAVDLTVPGRGLDFVFARTYRSGLLFNGVLGRGWDHNYNYRLVETTADSLSHVQQTFPGAVVGDVARMDGSGRADLYTQNMDGSYTAPTGYFTRLTRSLDGSFTERFSDGTLMKFLAADGAGLSRLGEIADRFDNTLELEYTDGQLTRVRDVYDRSYDFFYDQAGRLTQLTDFDGRSVTYQYDTSGNLLGATSPVITGTSTGNDFASGRTWQYSYSSGQAARSENHNLLTVTAPNEVATGGPARLSLTYDAADRVISQSLGGTNASTVPSGGVWSYSYTSLAAPAPGNPGLAVDQTMVTDGNGNETEYRFNTLGNTLRTEEFTNRNLRSTDPASFVVAFTYNADGQRLTSTLPEGNSFQWTFDSANADRLQQGNLLSETMTADMDRGGDQTQLTTVLTYEPIFNQVRTFTEPRGQDAGYTPQNGGAQSAARYTQTSSFDYEEAFDLTSIGARIGLTMAQVQTLFTAAGISTTPRGDLNGDADTSQHSGHAVRMDAPSVTLLTGSDQALAEGDTTQDVFTLTRFNDFGQIVSVTDPEENVHTYEYYPANDPDGDGLDVIAGGDAMTGGYVEQITLDSQSGAGRNTGSDPTPTSIRTLHAYDDRGNLTRLVNGRGIATDYEYNAVNELVQVTDAAAHDLLTAAPAEPVTLEDFAYLDRFFYDANGNLVLSQTEDRGNTSNVDGNPLAGDLPAGVSNPDPAGGTAFVDTVFHYDLLDRVVETVQEVDNSSGEFLHTRMRYDANGNAVLTIQPEGNAETSVYDERDLVFTTTRGALSAPSAALLSGTDPTAYDVRGGLAGITLFRYDGNANLIETGDADDTDGSAANNSSLGSGDRTRMLYDGFDRITSVVDSVGNQMVMQYDPAGNACRQLSFGPVGGASPTSDGPGTLSGPVSSGGVIQSGNLVNSNLLSVTEISLDEQSRAFQTDQVLFVNTIATQRTPDVNDGATDLGEGDLTPGDDQAIPGVTGVTILGRVSMQTDYDRNGRPTFVREDDTETHQSLYDGVDRMIHTIDPEGNQMRIAYDDAGNVIETATTEVSQAMNVLDEVFLETNFFDSLDRPVRRVDNIGQTTESRFDSRGNLVAQTDARGPATGFLTTITRRAFAEGTLTSNAINDFGNVTTFQYDGLSRPVQSELVMTASGDGDGVNIGATTEGVPSTRPTVDTAQGGGDGLIRIRTLYDGNSLNVARIDDQGNVTVNLFDNQNRLVVETFGVTVSTTLDNSTLLGSRTVPTPTAATVNNPAVISTTLIDTQLAGTKTRIDAVAGSFPAGADQIDATTSVVFGLDPEGHLRILEDQNDTETFTAFDALGRPIAARYFRAGQSDSHSGDSLFAPVPVSDLSNSSGGLPAIVGTTIQDFEYDGLSRPTRMTDNNDPLDAADDSIATRAYDSLSRVIEETQQVGALSPRAVSTSWRAEHLPSAVVYPNGREVERLFDGLDRAVSFADAAPPAPVSSGLELSSHDNPLAEISYVGPCCRPVSIGFGNGTGMDTRASSDFDDFLVAHEDDFPGALSVILDQTFGSFEAGSVISLDRIEGGHIAPPDACATMHLHSGGGITIDGEGPFSDPNPPVCGFGQVVATGFDGDRRPVIMVHRDAEGNVIAGFDNVYDSNGNRLVDDKRHQPTDSHVSGFDSANRLIAFDRGTINSSRDGIQTPSSRQTLHSLWDLDGAGNWDEVTSGAGVTETREHSNFNEITSRSDGTTTNTASDDNGNQTDDGTFTFEHDAHNRIVRVTRQADGLVVAEYDYDASGRRIRRVVVNSGPLDGTTVYYYDDWQAVEERDGADVLARQFVFGEGLDQVLLKDENLDGDDSATGAGDRRLFYHADSDGSIQALTDSTGKRVEGYLYDAFGRTTVFSPGPNGMVDFGGDDGIVVEGAGGENNPFMFTGRRFDAETGQFYFRHRYFDPNEGRFVTRDPLGGASHQSFYSYDGRDPMGLGSIINKGKSKISGKASFLPTACKKNKGTIIIATQATPEVQHVREYYEKQLNERGYDVISIDSRRLELAVRGRGQKLKRQKLLKELGTDLKGVTGIITLGHGAKGHSANLESHQVTNVLKWIAEAKGSNSAGLTVLAFFSCHSWSFYESIEGACKPHLATDAAVFGYDTLKIQKYGEKGFQSHIGSDPVLEQLKNPTHGRHSYTDFLGWFKGGVENAVKGVGNAVKGLGKFLGLVD